MKEEILKALTTKFPGVSASVLGRIADKLSKTVTTAEQVKTAVDGVTIQQVIDSYADSRATEASETARKNSISEYETRYGLKNGEKINHQNQGGNQDQGGNQNQKPAEDEMPAWAKAINERMDKFFATQTSKSRRDQLSAITAKLPDTLRKAYDHIPVDKYSEEEFAKLVETVTTEAGDAAKVVTSRGGVFGRPGSHGNGNQNEADLTKEEEAAIAVRSGGVVKNGEQPF